MLPRLDFDEATRLALPLEEPTGEAQHRFLYQIDSGEESWVLARLIVCGTDDQTRKNYHLVALRPENSSEAQLSLCCFKGYMGGQGEINTSLTPSEAQAFDWDAFSAVFNQSRGSFELYRYWFGVKEGRSCLFWLNSLGEGKCWRPDEQGSDIYNLMSGGIFAQSWRPDKQNLRADGDVKGVEPYLHHYRFLMQKRYWEFLHLVDFDQIVSQLWQDENSELSRAERWLSWTNEERIASILACENGNWSELQRVAYFVLVVRIAQEKKPFYGECHWDFAEYGDVELEFLNSNGFETTFPETFLAQWQKAIISVFRPALFSIKPQDQPKYIEYFLLDMPDDYFIVQAKSPSEQEILEAQQQLSSWAHAHFSPDEARRLLEF